MAHVAERYIQLRPAVPRSEGTTDTERYLKKLAELSFLDLWSYANPYRNQKIRGAGNGKELCDLIVVCDPHVIIFSEKNIAWPSGDTELAWRRWYKRAVHEAANQIRGAERWVRELPSEIFLDPDCTIPFPIDFPPPDRMVVHRVIVARGAGNACKEYFGGGTGSMVVASDVKGKAHFQGDHVRPFVIADVDPDGQYVHVLDDATLEIVLTELDTVTDFTRYLTKKEALIRSGKVIEAEGEEDLLAYYSVRTDSHGEHDFVPPAGSAWDDIDVAHFSGGAYKDFVTNPQYQQRQKADEASYVWDGLIKAFTQHMLGGTSIVLDGYDFDLKKSEHAVRYMALEDRVSRRSFAQGILGALEKGRKQDRFFRGMMPPNADIPRRTGYIVLTVKYADFMAKGGGYDQYRHFRIANLKLYGEAMLMKNPHLERVVGIAMEPVEAKVSSEDITVMFQKEWTDEDQRSHTEECERFGILRNLTEFQHHTQEFDPVPKSKAIRRQRSVRLGNRAQRRRAKAMARKRR